MNGTKIKNLESFIKKLKKYKKELSTSIEYTDKTFLKDIIYFLGISIDENNYNYAEGLKKFTKYLNKTIK